MSEQILRVGVVGLGEISQYMHLPHLTSLPNIKVTAMCDLSPSLVAQVADRYGVAKRYTSYPDLLEQRGREVAHGGDPDVRQGGQVGQVHELRDLAEADDADAKAR